MIQVLEQQIGVTLPSTCVKMLIAQPYLEFQNPLQEPFPLRAECTQRLLAVIDNVFQNARTFHPKLVLFPEFALPGVEGVQQVASHMTDEAVLSPTIAIAGVSGLTRDEYRRLCALPNVSAVDAANTPDRVGDAEWVNAAVTFIKDDSGRLFLWIQPKISPSWPETQTQHQSMFHGRVVRVFRAQFDNEVPCRFLSLVCFDWVGSEDGAAVPETVLQQYDAACRKGGSPQDLQWVFVLQYNPSPNHPSFLNATTRFLTQATHPFARRQDAAVIMVSAAASRVPKRSGPHGYCSLTFGPRAPFDTGGCLPTVATQSSRLRASNALGTCKDAVFREMGECIHLAEVRVPHSVVPDVTDRTHAVVQATALPLLGAVIDPRIPGQPVPAVIKWVNDELDEVPDLCAAYFVGSPHEGILRTSQINMVNGYRQLRAQDLAIRIDGACASRAARAHGNGDPAADIDTVWNADERRGLQHVIQSLTLIGGAAGLDVNGSQLHARSSGVEIAAICGTAHSHCVTAFKRLAARTHAPIVFVSRDDNNAKHSPREAESFADPRQGAGVNLTDSQTLLEAARSKTVPEYQQFITELLNVTDRRFI